MQWLKKVARQMPREAAALWRHARRTDYTNTHVSRTKRGVVLHFSVTAIDAVSDLRTTYRTALKETEL